MDEDSKDDDSFTSSAFLENLETQSLRMRKTSDGDMQFVKSEWQDEVVVPPASCEHQEKYCNVQIDKDVFDSWCRVGADEGLHTDTEIASFFINQYRTALMGQQLPAHCVNCNMPLAMVCANARCRLSSGQKCKLSGRSENALGTTVHKRHAESCKDSPVDSQDYSRGCSDRSEPSGLFSEVEETNVAREHHLHTVRFFSGVYATATAADGGGGEDNSDERLRQNSPDSSIPTTTWVAQLVQNETQEETVELSSQVNCQTILMDDHHETQEKSHEKDVDRNSPQMSRRLRARAYKCSQCERVFKTAAGLKHHHNVHAREKQYKCHHCKASFRWHGSLKRHMERHSAENQHQCQICKKHFKTPSGVEEHMTRKHKDHSLCQSEQGGPQTSWRHPQKLEKENQLRSDCTESQACPYCAEMFDRTSKLRRHMKIHREKETLTCYQCSKTFSCLESLRKHMEKVHKMKKKRSFSCSECNAVFSSHSRLTIHQRIHTGEKPYICDFCGTAFSQYFTLSVHRRTHTGEKPYQCQECEESFAGKKSLDYHMFKHTKTLASLCHLCGAWFRTSDHLADHLRRHADTRDFKCHLCDKGFKTKSDRYSHIMYTHPQKAKSFKCPECELAFVTKSLLKKHSRKHTGERPYHCEHCSKTFSYLSSLSAHRKLHDGKKQFTCEVCGAAFVMQWGLTLHMRKHTGEKPYQCQICGEAYSWHSGLKNHMRKHEN